MEQILKIDLIRDVLLSHVPTDDMVSLAQTCKAAKTAVNSYKVPANHVGGTLILSHVSPLGLGRFYPTVQRLHLLLGSFIDHQAFHPNNMQTIRRVLQHFIGEATHQWTSL